jgi:TIR domain
MSVSLYRGQVDRLTKEIADLEKKAADERTRAAKERSDALRKSNSIGRGTSVSTMQSKLRGIQRHEERAAQHERRAADRAAQVARKRRSLTSSQKSLERALADDRRKAEQAAKRRRDEDIRHLRKLEDARRASQAPMTTPFRPAVGIAPTRRLPAPAARDDAGFEYDVCLSFASEQRDYVEMIASGLKERDLRVFYDADETVNLWGKDLAEHLDYIYKKASRYCVVFVSEAYAAKPWTRHERRSALSRAIEEEGEYILPARFDDTELPGLRPTVAYVDLRQYAPETLIEFLIEKVTVTRAAGGVQTDS